MTAELTLMGRALGGLRWVQGPGGNVSVKAGDGQLWIKASGKRLRDVGEDGGHVQVPLAVVERALEGDIDADRALFTRAPRPSLETYFHAFEGTAVAHTHALGVLLYACSNAPYQPIVDARSGMALPEAPIYSIPYVRPGRGVALAMRPIFESARGEALVILRSHGVVAFAPSAARAIELTQLLDDAVQRHVGPLPDIEDAARTYVEAPVIELAEGGVFRRLPQRAGVPTPEPRYLFPDAPVCASQIRVASLADVPRMAARALSEWKRACILVDVEGRRVAVAQGRVPLEFACEVLAAHDWLEDALLPRGIAHYLNDEEPARILSLPAEQYRIRLGEQAC